MTEKLREEFPVIVHGRMYFALVKDDGISITPEGEDFPEQYLLWYDVISLLRLKNEAYRESGGNFPRGQRLWLEKVAQHISKKLRESPKPSIWQRIKRAVQL